MSLLCLNNKNTQLSNCFYILAVLTSSESKSMLAILLILALAQLDAVEKRTKQRAEHISTLNTQAMVLIANLQQAAKATNHLLNESVQQYKITGSGVDVMATLLRCGPPYSLSPGELLAKMLITSGTMTSRIDKLEKKGLVKRKIKKNDKRSVNVALTKKGLHLIQEVVIEHNATQEKIVAVFDDNEQALFITLLQKYINQNITKQERGKKKP